MNYCVGLPHAKGLHQNIADKLVLEGMVQTIVDMLLKEEETRQKNMNVVDRMSNRISDFIQRLEVRSSNEDAASDESVTFYKNPPGSKFLTQTTATSLNQLHLTAPNFDYIELFADVTKWLEYDVLINNYRGVLSINGHMLGSSWESALFGLLSALSSQLYTDVLYIYSDLGNPIKREKTLKRTLEGWASLYSTKCLSAATLFGVYEAVRAPTSRFLSRLVSGGMQGCIGSILIFAWKPI